MYFHKADVDGNGRLSYPELVKALNCSKATAPGLALRLFGGAALETWHLRALQRSRPRIVEALCGGGPGEYKSRGWRPRRRAGEIEGRAGVQEHLQVEVWPDTAVRGEKVSAPLRPRDLRHQQLPFAAPNGWGCPFICAASPAEFSEPEGTDPESSKILDLPKWRLIERLFEREKYLVDPETSNVYTRQKGVMPVLRGRMVAGPAAQAASALAASCDAPRGLMPGIGPVRLQGPSSGTCSLLTFCCRCQTPSESARSA